MAGINWMEVYLKKNNDLIKVLEVKESVCDIEFRRKELEVKEGYYEDVDSIISKF